MEGKTAPSILWLNSVKLYMTQNSFAALTFEHLPWNWKIVGTQFPLEGG